jgi:hypothetical protein
MPFGNAAQAKNTRMRAGERGVLQRSDFTVDVQM